MLNRQQSGVSRWMRAFCILLLMALILPITSASAEAQPVAQRASVKVATAPPLSAGPDVGIAGANLLANPGFELGAAGWQESNTKPGSSICSTIACSEPGAGPRSGSWWAWLGGYSDAAVSQVLQDVWFPNCGATFQFYLKMAVGPGAGADDFLQVYVGWTPVWTVNATQAATYADYTLVTIDLSGAANGAFHTVGFNSNITGHNVSFHVDDVSLTGGCTISGNAEIPGVTMYYQDGVWKSVMTDGAGNYSLTVPYGWIGTVTPVKAGFSFTPANISYPFVSTVQTGQNYSIVGVFDDVPTVGKEWMEPWIVAFYNAGITTGCGTAPLRYCPEQNVTRAEMAVFLLRARHGAGYVPPANPWHIFIDMPVPGKEWMQPWADEYYREGLTTGCGPGPIFCPENNVTRAEMAVFVLRALHTPGWTPPAATGLFSDVPVAGKEWMEPWIIAFYNAGITTGCGAGNYCPEANVTRAEMAVFIGRAYGLYP